MRVDDIIRQVGKPESFDNHGHLCLTDRQSAKIPVSFLSFEYSEDDKKTLSCVTDGTFLKVSSDDSYDVALRYDAVEFWLQPSAINFDALARVTLKIGREVDGPDGTPSAIARFPVMIKRSKSRVFARVATSTVGAFLVALPAIMGQNSSLELRVVSAVIGAALIAMSTILMARWSEVR